ncbi:MAG: tannase/feruloyl esterase family alpha/beta hydrolase [Gammaproteobacteria bacterium]|nr:tannase/feruloyl esterase family alpha/beta hydrolase [Gammaproteobacteria bacterium]
MAKATLVASVLVLFALPATAGAWGLRCHNLVRLTDLSHAIEPGIEVLGTDEAPWHCRVRGVINRAIRFEVRMPIVANEVTWNGRLMFSTVGGGAGVIGDTTSLLSRGFAMASTDTGHEASEGNAFYRQPEALLDYAYRGVHLATQAAKRIVTHFYGRDIEFSYLQGCSNGGRAAMLEATRFPNDYDGIIAGAPVFRFEEFVPWAVGVHRVHSKNPLTPDALRVLDNASRKACDGLDGVEDGVINDPRLCTSEVFDAGALLCEDGETDGCLTAGQIDTARFVYADMTDADGNVLSPGVPPGAEAAGDWRFWMLPNEAFGGESILAGVGELLTLMMRHTPGFDVEVFDPVADRDVIADATSPLDVGTYDLSEFRDRGGKLLMYQGWNDFPLRPQRAIDYLNGVKQTMGDWATDDFLRLFMVPGMVHCAGGPGAWETDYVEPLVAWREQGTAPDRLVAKTPEPVEMAHLAPDESVAQQRRFSRPLCPYPELARYRGEGDKDDAASFDCRAP